MQVNVLGTKYSIIESNRIDDPNLENNDGYCDHSTKTIVIDTFQGCENHPNSLGNIDEYKKSVIRHELIHAFLHESGLNSCSWAKEEEIVDWIAIQFPKLMDAFESSNCI